MDVSGTYIKMCEKAEEIQKLLGALEPTTVAEQVAVWTQPTTFVQRAFCHIPSKDDPQYEFWFGADGELVFLVKSTGEKIALPRQDQLQEMVFDIDAITTELKFHGWIITSNYIPIGLPQPSMEQLWLAFVMSEKYQKKWNGTEWGENEN